MVKNKQPSDSEDQKEDYYWESGLMVFTRAFHLKRGYCCQSGCRHCPYGFERLEEKDPDGLAL